VELSITATSMPMFILRKAEVNIGLTLVTECFVEISHVADRGLPKISLVVESPPKVQPEH
jgi:hypothetical protein